MFPITFDTKYISEFINSSNNNTTLKGLFDHLCTTDTNLDNPTSFNIYTLPNTHWNIPSNLHPLINKIINIKSNDSTSSYTTDCSPLETKSNSLRPSNSVPTAVEASSNYLSLKSKATPGDRGDLYPEEQEMSTPKNENVQPLRTGILPGGTEDVNPEEQKKFNPEEQTSSGKPVADLREAEGQLNKEGHHGEWMTMTSCGTPSGNTSSEMARRGEDIVDKVWSSGGLNEDRCFSNLIDDLDDVELSMIHDAGYDSFMTSIVFILQFNSLYRSKVCGKRLKDNKLFKNGHMRQNLLNVLNDLKNCIKLVKSQPNVINLSSSNENDMARHFYMFGYPNSWKKYEIMKIWSPLWININSIDDNSCWITVKNDDDIRNLNLIYKMMKNPQFTLYNYQQYKQHINQV